MTVSSEDSKGRNEVLSARPGGRGRRRSETTSFLRHDGPLQNFRVDYYLTFTAVFRTLRLVVGIGKSYPDLSVDIGGDEPKEV